MDKMNENKELKDVPVENPYYGQALEAHPDNIGPLRSNSQINFQNVKVSENPYYEQ